MNINELRDLLRTNCVTVVFTKKDGSIRELFCTTMPEILGEGESTSKPSDTIVTAWDLENEGWRSFKFDSVIKYVAAST